MSRKNLLARDIISYSGTMALVSLPRLPFFSLTFGPNVKEKKAVWAARLPWHDVFACTLLHRELRDYSLGQIAFAVFRVLFAITQLPCHVSAL